MNKTLLRIFSLVLVCTLLLPSVCAAEKTDDAVTVSNLSWEELEEKIRSESLNAQILSENISSIEIVDYTYIYNTLQKQLNELSSAQSFLLETKDYDKLNTLNASMATLRNTYEDIRDGKLQRDSDDAVNQLRDMQNRVVTAGQSLYITILSMEQSLLDGERGIEALDRSLKELNLRRSLGQISDMTVKELERTRDDTLSQLDTLKSTIFSCKAQLQLLIGEPPTGEIELGALPAATADEISSLDPDADLIAAKEKSYSISTAAVALEKAEEQVSDLNSDYLSGSVKRYELTAAEHSRDAAKLSSLSAEQEFEFAFRELYRSLQNCRQVWENKKAIADYRQQQLSLSQKQYDLGRISYFALLSAQDNAESALSAADGAERDFFAALNQYRNAVKYGIVD